MKAKTLIIIAMLIAFALVFAQPQGKGPSQSRDKFLTIKMWKLTETLDLSDEQAAKLFPLMRKYHKTMDSINQRSRELIKDLRELVDKNAKEKKLLPILNELESLNKKKAQAHDELWNGIKEILTVQQQAKYILFEQTFRRRMLELLRKPRKPIRKRR